jgi:hypothetical protein
MKRIRIFILTAGVILLVAALNRFLIAAGNAQVMTLPETLLGIPLRYAMLLVGGFELVVALICLFGKRVGLQIGWLAWLGTNYLVYWVGLLAMNIHPQATCIGSFTDPLYLARGMVGFVVACIPLYLVAGSYAALIWVWVEHRAGRSRQLALESSKISCPACGGHIAFSTRNVGQTVPCPHCRAAVVLRNPENLKMTCVLCGGHVEFPAHAIGQKIPCPHCAKTITLLKPI